MRRFTIRQVLLAPLAALSKHGTYLRLGRSQIYSDDGPPIGGAATQPWAEAAFEIEAWVPDAASKMAGPYVVKNL